MIKTIPKPIDLECGQVWETENGTTVLITARSAMFNPRTRITYQSLAMVEARWATEPLTILEYTHHGQYYEQELKQLDLLLESGTSH